MVGFAKSMGFQNKNNRVEPQRKKKFLLQLRVAALPWTKNHDHANFGIQPDQPYAADESSLHRLPVQSADG
jgi:hypothetical protein